MDWDSNIDDIISTLKPGQSLQEVMDFHHRNGRAVVIVSTYHSMQKLHNVDIDVIYCDEADKLVSNKPTIRQGGIKEETFMQKFYKVRAKKKYFLTATPKDWVKDWNCDNIEFMNNVAIFGERIEMEFYVAVKTGYIVQPYLHIVYPTEYAEDEDLESGDEEDIDFEGIDTMPEYRVSNVNIKAKIKMIADAFVEHKKFLKERSSKPDRIGAKLLIKCKNIRSEMWGIFHGGLREMMPNTKIFAGGSYGFRDTDNEEWKNNNHYFFNPESGLQILPNRDAYLNTIKALKQEEDAIVLHCDILSEGINVKAFTGIFFISGITQTDSKILQNIGRATRTIDEDRERLDSGEITLSDMSQWVKPFCSVIIPFWNAESTEAKDKLVTLVTELRNIGFEIEKFSTGTDINKDDKQEEEMDPQNEPTAPKKKSGIKDLEQDLEELDYLQKLHNLSPIDYILEMSNDETNDVTNEF